MNKTNKIVFAVLAAAALSGCATTQEMAVTGAEAVPAMEHQVSRPASYGSMGGYRYRRLVAVNITS